MSTDNTTREDGAALYGYLVAFDKVDELLVAAATVRDAG